MTTVGAYGTCFFLGSSEGYIYKSGVCHASMSMVCISKILVAGDLFGSAGGEIGIILTDLDFGL